MVDRREKKLAHADMEGFENSRKLRFKEAKIVS